MNDSVNTNVEQPVKFVGGSSGLLWGVPSPLAELRILSDRVLLLPAQPWMRVFLVPQMNVRFTELEEVREIGRGLRAIGGGGLRFKTRSGSVTRIFSTFEGQAILRELQNRGCPVNFEPLMLGIFFREG